MPTTTTSTWTWAWQWWGTLVAINAINLAVCLFLFTRPAKGQNDKDARYTRLMKAMGLVFIAVALYRSIFISSYLEQLAWFDSIFNSSLLIRFLAIFAEFSFSGLIARSLMCMNEELPELEAKKNKFAASLQTKAPLILFACIFTANIFATAATITKVDVLFAIEETLWGLAFLSIVPLLVMSLSKLFSNRRNPSWPTQRRFRTLAVILAIFAIGYSFYSLFYHLPIEYWPGALAQLRMQTPVPAFHFGVQAVRDALLVIHPTRDLQTWGGVGFVIWQTGYFSLCSWIVLFLMTGPRLLSTSPSTSPATEIARP